MRRNGVDIVQFGALCQHLSLRWLLEPPHAYRVTSH